MNAFLIFLILDIRANLLLKLKLCIAQIYVWFVRRRTLPFFEFDHKSTDPGKLGFLPLPEVRLRENPRSLPPDINAADTLAFCGVDKDGSVLVARITRRHNRVCETWVYLRLSSGEEFQLPNHPGTKVFNTGDNNFSAAGLSFEVLEPLKRWRVIFNGYLRRGIETELNNSDGNTVLVRFNFLWFPIGDYLSFPIDFSNSFLADVLARQKWPNGLVSPFKLFTEENIEQLGELHGKLKIEDEEEQELLLRGLKQRKHGTVNWRTLKDRVSIQGILNNGTGFHVFAEKKNDGQLRKYYHGYVLPPCNTIIHQIQKFSTRPDSLFELKNSAENISLAFSSGKNKYLLKLSTDESGFQVQEGEECYFKIDIKPVKVILNGKEGRGVIEFGCHCDGATPALNVNTSLPLLKEPEVNDCRLFVVSFNDAACRCSNIVGGKGASLANMSNLPYKLEDFTVPDCICLTRTAFEHYLSINVDVKVAILQMQQVAWKRLQGSHSDECDRVVQMILETDVPEVVKDALKVELLSVFGDESENMKFAIRSSAVGEDSAELSAAGQNETFLGVKTFDAICSSIVKCWASQFSFRSVEYKRQNGQLLNGGMGVVIQKMVPAEVAGVLFSRDPLTSSRGIMIISSNFGLGESVVSALADPDAITLRRSWNDKLSVLKTEIGTKKVMISMSDDSGTVESEVDEVQSSTCTLTDEMAIKLGKIAVFLEQCYGDARDIEWAVCQNQIYILQSRPLTSENAMTGFDILHEFDSGTRTDNEFMSTANVSEVCPGAVSPLSASILWQRNANFFQEHFSWRIKTHRFDPTVREGFFSFYGHPFFDQVQQKAWALEKKKSAMNKAMEVGLYGRVLDDDDVLEMALERFSNPPLISRMLFLLAAVRGMLFGKRLLQNVIKQSQNLSVVTDGATTSLDAYERLGKCLLWSDLIIAHLSVTLASSVWNSVILNIISSGAKEYSLDHYTDFAMLIGSDNGTESGDVPYKLRELASKIALEIEPEKFSSWSTWDAYQWLSEKAQESGKKFKEFLERHGHRGIKECDLSSLTWGLDPTGVVKILQDMLKLHSPGSVSMEEKNVENLVNSLKTPLSSVRRKVLLFFLHFCYNGIRQRELAKSFLVKDLHYARLAYRSLAEMMEAEGMLPDADLIHYLTHEEIGTVIQKRSASALRRAKQRRQLFPKMNEIKFPELIHGYPKPIEEEEDDISYDTTKVIKGFPVSQGVAQGCARVVLSFLDVGTIQPGEILITHATDIGWSPYFPMLAGVVTEIGGLISHGAVVAREFGIPCIVGAQNATKIFQSGDKVLLDATKGILSKIV